MRSGQAKFSENISPYFYREFNLLIRKMFHAEGKSMLMYRGDEDSDKEDSDKEDGGNKDSDNKDSIDCGG